MQGNADAGGRLVAGQAGRQVDADQGEALEQAVGEVVRGGFRQVQPVRGAGAELGEGGGLVGAE